jgi:hypothetical protein
VVYIHTIEYYSTIKKNDTVSFAGKWMEVEIIMLSEKSKTQKDKHQMFSLICGGWGGVAGRTIKKVPKVVPKRNYLGVGKGGEKEKGDNKENREDEHGQGTL